MTYRCLLTLGLTVFVFLGGDTQSVFSDEKPSQSSDSGGTSTREKSIRVATFNVSLYRKKSGQLAADLERDNPQAQQLAKIIRRVNPDVILLNEIDDDGGKSVKLFRDNYLHNSKLAQSDAAPIKAEPMALATGDANSESLSDRKLTPEASAYGSGKTESSHPELETVEENPWAYIFAPSVNTGVDSGLDLDNDGKTGTPADCWGYGEYAGQYGLAILSRYPIDTTKVRTFQRFLWCEMPDAMRPQNADGTHYWKDSVWSQLRLSSKTHVDVPITIGSQTLHILASHPTPPVFDGAEDRNGRRNHDEIRFFKDYIEWSATNPPESSYHRDDNGSKGALESGARFVILGDLNADPNDGSGLHDGIEQLLGSKQVNNQKTPESEGAVRAAKLQGKRNTTHQGNAAHDTGDFNDGNPGNLRCDFVLPSVNMEIVSSGVFWPSPEGLSLEDKKMVEATDHRLVWVDLLWPMH
jgi:endonuclease/exonuclease/phosphatase family metal-dependent hydrolase